MRAELYLGHRWVLLHSQRSCRGGRRHQPRPGRDEPSADASRKVTPGKGCKVGWCRGQALGSSQEGTTPCWQCCLPAEAAAGGAVCLLPCCGSLLWHTPLILGRKTTNPWKSTPTSMILQQTGGKKPALPWPSTQQGQDLKAGRAFQHPSPASFPDSTKFSHGSGRH